MSDESTQLDWFHANLAAYVAGGLSKEERASLGAMALADPALAAEMEQMMALDLSLKQSAGMEAILAGLESRLSAALPSRRWAIHPTVRKAAFAAAACVLLGTAGYYGSTAMERGTLVGWISLDDQTEMGRPKAASDLRQIGQAINLYNDRELSRFSRSNFTRLGDERADSNSNGTVPLDFMGDQKTAHIMRNGVESAAIQKNPDRNADDKRMSYSYVNVYPAAGAVGHGNKYATTAFSNEFAVTADQEGDIKTQNESQQSNGQNAVLADGHYEFPSTELERAKSNSPAGSTAADPMHATDGALAINLSGGINGQFTAGREFRGAVPVSKPDAFRGTSNAPNSVTIQKEAETKMFRPLSGKVVAIATSQPLANGAAPAAVVDARKIIRTGQMEFEVDRFDSAAAIVSKVVGEELGFIATVSSDKLANGKMRGQIILRVPPEHLDALVLQLRSLGDLKSQQIGSADVTKEYTDLDSELRADRAMEERLLELIKNGKGEIKDLLAAEKELAEWRGKIEKIIGQMKYYDNQVSLSTLAITLTEKDIQTPAATTEQETINAGIETADVEKARAAALQILADAKARIVSADLKKLDAGQMASTIVADIPPDAAGPAVDRIRQLGKVARMESQRALSADPNTSSTTTANTHVERKDSRLTLSLYNLANVAPRQSSTVLLAASDVQAAYAAILGKTTTFGGRVVASNATQSNPDASRADGQIEVPADQAEPFLAELRSLGEIVSLTTTDNPDTANVTVSKRGFAIHIESLAALPARQTTSFRIETPDVERASAEVQASLIAGGGRIVSNSTNTGAGGDGTATLAFEVPLAKAADLIASLRGTGKVVSVTSSQNAGAPTGPLARAAFEVIFSSPSQIVAADSGLMANLRHGLSLSAAGLLYSLQLVVIGVCFVLPWVVILWVGTRVLRRKKQTAAATT